MGSPRVLALAATVLLALTSPVAAGERVEPVLPHGALRVPVFLNPVNLNVAAIDPVSGELIGIGGDLSRELASRLGVPLVVVEYSTFREIGAAVDRDEWDVAFQARSVALASGAESTSPYLLAPQTYLVRAGDPFSSVADVDAPGVRIGVSLGNPADMFLSRELQHAELVRVDALDTGVAMLLTDELDAVATGRQQLLPIAERNPAVVVLDDSFTAEELVIGVPRGQRALLEVARSFVEAAISSGLVERAIARNRVPGVSVPPGRP